MRRAFGVRRGSWGALAVLPTALLAVGAAPPALDLVNVAGDPCPHDSCLIATFTFDRANTDPARAISVTFQLSPELELCEPDSSPYQNILQGSWLSSYDNGGQDFFVVDNGGGSYTVDQAILGLPCGITVGGEIFLVRLRYVAPMDSSGYVTVTDVIVRDCVNDSLPGFPGLPKEFTCPISVERSTWGSLKTLLR